MKNGIFWIGGGLLLYWLWKQQQTQAAASAELIESIPEGTAESDYWYYY